MDNIDWQQVIQAFHAKAKYKGLSFTDTEQFINDKTDKVLKSAWKNSLEHQIASGTLPDYEMARGDLKVLFEKVF